MFQEKIKTRFYIEHLLAFICILFYFFPVNSRFLTEFYCAGTPAVANGALQCRHDNFIYKCRANCNQGYVSLDGYGDEHMCGSHGWIPEFPEAYATMSCMSTLCFV